MTWISDSTEFDWYCSRTDEYILLVDLISGILDDWGLRKNSMLDIGSGPGRLLIPLGIRFKQLVAIEPNPLYAASLRNSMPGYARKLRVVQDYWPDADLGSRQFGLVICAHTLYYVPTRRWPHALSKIGRHLNEDGAALVAMVSSETHAGWRIEGDADIRPLNAAHKRAEDFQSMLDLLGVHSSVFRIEATSVAQSIEEANRLRAFLLGRSPEQQGPKASQIYQDRMYQGKIKNEIHIPVVVKVFAMTRKALAHLPLNEVKGTAISEFYGENHENQSK